MRSASRWATTSRPVRSFHCARTAVLTVVICNSPRTVRGQHESHGRHRTPGSQRDRRVRFHDPTGEPARWRQRSRPPRGEEPRGGVVCGGRVEGVSLPGVAAGWTDSAGIARSCGRGLRGSRRRLAACSPESGREPVLWLTVRESTRGRGGGDEGVGWRWGSFAGWPVLRQRRFFAGPRLATSGRWNRTEADTGR